MATPSIAHFGTTLPEEAPPPDAVQIEIPFSGALEATDDMLRRFGFELMIRNMYPGVGRQYIYKRGQHSDVDYVEKDSFTSYSSWVAEPEADGAPRHGDTIFRLPHRDAAGIVAELAEAGLVRVLGAADEQGRVLVVGPDSQTYEITPTVDDRVANHAIAIWTTPDEVDQIVADYHDQFGLELTDKTDFHGIADAVVLTRSEPPVTIMLLVPKAGGRVAERLTDDVFGPVGFSHFRLGAPSKAVVQASPAAREAFPDTGDVSYVHFHHAYLELVEC